MIIRKDRFYILARTQRNCYGYIHGQKELTIVTGHKAANERPDVVREWTPTSQERFELGDGHLPGYRPIVDGLAASRWLQDNPFQTVYPCKEAQP